MNRTDSDSAEAFDLRFVRAQRVKNFFLVGGQLRRLRLSAFVDYTGLSPRARFDVVKPSGAHVRWQRFISVLLPAEESLMAEEVRLWKIENRTELRSLTRSKLDLEERLEGLLDGDVSVLSDDLLVIGRQTQPKFGGYIDLLCLDRNGDVVIVELKRDKTPREITAQTLDYASWVRELSRDAVVGIAESYLAQRGLKL